MKFVKEYICDDIIPSDEEISECIAIATQESCIVNLRWFFPRNGWHNLYIREGSTLEECKGKVPHRYSV